MKKMLLTLTLGASFANAAMDYQGPPDERMPPGRRSLYGTLGLLAQNVDVCAVADVIEEETDHIKVRVVTPVYGCTNAQELVIERNDRGYGDIFDADYDPNWEYSPTNNSRIVFATVVVQSQKQTYSEWTPKCWTTPPDPEVITRPGDELPFPLRNRHWWYDGYQDNIPFNHLTNLIHAVWVERNWTNFYHICRDAIPTPASPRVWEDSWQDMRDLLRYATQAQFDYILNDPLFPAEMQERRQDIFDRWRRKGEDE